MLLERLGKELLFLDGGTVSYTHLVYTGDRITISRSEKTAKLLKLSEESFLETLRKKMKGN